jgi:cellulose synthase (UDP-forming)
MIVFAITKISPRSRRWSRTIVVSILLVLTLRYILWRVATLNLVDSVNATFSIGLLLLESITLTSTLIQLFLTLRLRDRKREADYNSIAVVDQEFTPTVDIFIPTYNESVAILRRTVIGCQALDYANKTVYLLDDTNRSEVRELAKTLGCEYLARTENRYAKAGNLNHALSRTTGELVVVFDADFVPTRNFLTRTVGFFQSRRVALVQTPQSFYNPDAIAQNLGLEKVLTHEEEVFYRQIQPIRDGSGTPVCSGTSFVVRRSCLEKIGGFVTDSISEDYFTGIRLSARGYELVYLNEKLSAGLAAETIPSYATQRLRWARGTLQAFFIKANPLTIPGLTVLQRVSHLEGLLHWFTSFSRIGYALMPLAFTFLGVIPIWTTTEDFVSVFIPYYVINLTVFSWLNERSRSALVSDVYSLVLAFPIAWTVVQVMLKPFSKGFQVTPKGIRHDRNAFNWNIALPLIGLWLLSGIGFWKSIYMSPPVGTLYEKGLQGFQLSWLWSGYNLLMITMALLSLIDVPKVDPHTWLNLQLTVCLKNLPGRSKPLWGMTTMVSEGGARVLLPQSRDLDLLPGESRPVDLEIVEAELVLPGRMALSNTKSESPTLDIAFDRLSLSQYRRLVELLFCRPGQWKHQSSPGEFRSLFLILKTLLKPRILWNRTGSLKGIAVTQPVFTPKSKVFKSN